MLHSLRPPRSWVRWGSVGLLNLLLTTLSLIALMPLLYILSVSFQSMPQILKGAGLIPRPFTLAAYHYAFTEMSFFLYLKNTLMITVGAMIGAFVSNTLAAYGFARFRFPGRELLLTILLTSIMLPGTVRMVPTFILFQKLGWVNTFLPLIVPAYFGSPFFVFMLRQFFRTLPEDFFDAATIDGANEFTMLTKIVLPLSKPAVATMLIFSVQGSWNDFLGPLLYLRGESLRTLSLGLYIIRSEPQGVPTWNNMMAVAVLMVLPVMILFALFQRHFVEGLTLTGLKG